MNNNLSMLTDLYQFTMANGYLLDGREDDKAVFDYFVRFDPFFVVAGIEQFIDYIHKLNFSYEDISYLASLNLFDKKFLDYLSNFRFTGKIYAMDEGTIAFHNEPVIRVEGNIIECQLIESTLLNIMNHQSLIATETNKIVRTAYPNPIIDMGLRRAHGPTAALYGSRAAYIGGCLSTSNVLAGQMFGEPVGGTHGHSWIMSFDSELEAFYSYAEKYPNNCILLLDTYNVLNSGLPNALIVFKDMKSKGHRPIGIRLDSGDLARLSKETRRILDENGFTDVKIFATNDLDANIIQSLKCQDAKIDVYGVGTKLITAYNNSALPGVYKLSEINGIPKMKLSENIEKITNPGKKNVIRLFDKNNNKALADLIVLDGEEIDTNKPLTIYHPTVSWKKINLKDFYTIPLLSLYYDCGKINRTLTLQEARENLQNNLNLFWEEYLRLDNPQGYKVDISDKLYDLKKSLMPNC